MWLRYLTIVVLFLIFALLQVSFLPYFNIRGVTINLVFIFFFILIFFDQNKEGFFVALLAGFLLDVFLPSYFGISVIALLAIYLIGGLVTYFLKEGQEKFSIFYFVASFVLSLVLYHFILYLALSFFHVPFALNQNIVVSVLYNLAAAIAGFYLFRFASRDDSLEKQLKLF